MVLCLWMYGRVDFLECCKTRNQRNHRVNKDLWYSQANCLKGGKQKVEVVQDLYIWLAEEIVQVFWNSHRAKHGETSAIWNYPDTGLKIVLSTRSYKLFWTWNVLNLISPTILIGVDEFPVRNIWTMHFLLWKLVFDVITFHLGRHFGEASKAHVHFNVSICLW